MLFQERGIRQKRNRETDRIRKIDRTGNMEMTVWKKQKYGMKKRERNCSHGCREALRSPLCRAGRFLPEKVSLCASFILRKKACLRLGKDSHGWKKIGIRLKKASLTLETAMVMPLFLLGLTAMISFMDVYKLQTEHLMRLCEKAKRAGMYASVQSNGGLDEILLPDLYAYHPVGGIIPLPSIWLHTTVKVRAWTGKEWEVFQDGDGQEEEEMVYVTESGTVFHRNPGCSHLNLSVSRVGSAHIQSMTNRRGERYSACEICCLGQAPGGSVYITSSGNRYHNLENCSGLKRTLKMVKRSQVKGMSPCSRCG